VSVSDSIAERRTAGRRERRTCKHFNGVQNKTCKAGVVYDDIEREKDGVPLSLPCLKLGPREQASCSHFIEPSDEEYAEEGRRVEASMARMRTVMPVVAEWRKKPPRGKGEIIECPACKGRLHLSQAASNGHVWGRCETAGCVSWIE